MELRQLLDLLFPSGLAVIRLPFIEQGGSAVALERAVKPEVRAKLASIVVGKQTLEQVFDDWMAAAHELARAVKQRAELVAHTRPSGTDGQAHDLRAARGQWVRAVRGLLWVLESKPQIEVTREAVVAVLDRALATAQRRGAHPEEALDDIEDDAELVGGIEEDGRGW